VSTLNKDHYAGGLLVALGAAVVIAGLGYQTGTLRQMGSGFFPVVLGALLALVGIAVLATAPSGKAGKAESGRAAGAEHAHLSGSPVQWRGWGCILGGVLAFVVLGDHGGLVPASFVSVFVAALGDRANTVRSAALLAAVMTVFGVIVFHGGLHVLLPLFAW
jgi:hypothetical protein